MEALAFRKALLALSAELSPKETRAIFSYSGIPSAERTDKVILKSLLAANTVNTRKSIN